MISLRKLPIKIVPSATRMLIRPFIPGNTSQLEHILERIFSTPLPIQIESLAGIYDRLELPNSRLKSIFLRHYELVREHISRDTVLSEDEKVFIGACFTQQYALESTALFNPSIVPHPIQDKAGITKFIISLRAIGEGHVSSITFMEGEIDQNLRITIKENSPYIYESERHERSYRKDIFVRKAAELGILAGLEELVFSHLEERFTFADLEHVLYGVKNSPEFMEDVDLRRVVTGVRMLAQSNFTLSFSTDTISERAIYPASPSQSNGLEDARFVKFTEDDGSSIYYATFTAYDGKIIMPELLETYDFNEFKVSTLNGTAAKNKGMALFPRKINGEYMMIGRQDNESLYIMRSDNPYFWNEYELLVDPKYSWEMVQIGNCGSPIEIEEGWLVITHGVGPVRTYSLGAILLDKEQPWKVIGRLKEPLLTPSKEERFGYVPNVFYTCGAMALGRTLVLPYAIGDVVTTFTLVNIDELVNAMRA
jgi:predicted GH43/DUF377 family glycosyl hydrolase